MSNKYPEFLNHRIARSDCFVTILKKVNPPVSTQITRDLRRPVEHITQERIGVQLHGWLREQ